MTEPNKQKIRALHRAGEPLKLIAGRFGVSVAKVSAIALQMGCEPRHVHAPRLMTLKLRPSLYDDLALTARLQHTSPDVIAREAIAAYLGHDR
jgi:signal transduction histidine kinase